MKVKYTSWVGNGVNDRAISVPGINPDLVVVKAVDAALNAVFSTDKMTAGRSLSLREDQTFATDLIKSMSDGQIVLGTGGRVNQSGVTYACMLVEDNGAGDFATFSFLGDGNDGKVVTLGFEPIFICAKAESTITGTHTYASRTSQNRGFQYWAGNARSDLFASIDPTGFTVNNGSSSESGANEINIGGVTTHGFAFKSVPGYTKVLTYTGNATLDRTVTGIGFTPALAWLKSYDTSGPVRMRFPAFAGLNSADIDGSQGTNAIRGLSSDTMTLGTDSKVNGSAKEYHAFFLANDFTTSPSVSTPSAILALEPIALEPVSLSPIALRALPLL